ncbi:hypothetical protein TWF730_002857 [Orbilia blumenaviensis]|uniref:F-box domain-containing protein n=1 Tax=Orbilia blumenaviensis TaxID=1796055 RepID=A0AAV9UBP2_9PEZI
MENSQGTVSSSPLLRIPQELLLQILALLPIDDQITAIKVCSTFHDLILYTPSLRNTRYALDSGATQVMGSLSPYPKPGNFPIQHTHMIMTPQSTHPFSNLFCTSTGDTITRYAYLSRHGGGSQSGKIVEEVCNEPLTQEEIEAEKDTIIIALVMAIYRFKVQDITNCPFLDEPYFQPSMQKMAAAGSGGNELPSDNDESYITFDCQVVVHRSHFQENTQDPPDWEERLRITKDMTVRQVTAALLKAAYEKLTLTGLKPDETAENVIRLRKFRHYDRWAFLLLHYRTSPETRNMFWKPENTWLGEYAVSRRVSAES